MLEQGVELLPADAADAGLVIECRSLAALLQAGLDEAVELAIWPRKASQATAAAFANLDLSGFEDIRIIGAAGAVLEAAEAWLDELDWPLPVTGTILSDLHGVLAPVRQIEASCTFRLEYVTDNACRRFHKDETDFRLITTYLGRGTQWHDAACGAAPPDISEMMPFEMAMLLGQRCSLPNRILHRSPPIEGTDVVRLVMVLDIERPEYC